MLRPTASLGTRRCVVLIAFLVLALVPAAPASAQTAPATALLQDLEWRTIGPANMVGRITDIEAVESRPQTVFVATASGGIFKSVNGGTTWDHLFSDETT